MVGLVFMWTSVFYSPQYVVWLLSFVPFLSRTARWHFAVLSVVTFLYFPIAFRLQYYDPSGYLRFYSMTLAVVAMVRVAMLVNLWDRPTHGGVPEYATDGSDGNSRSRPTRIAAAQYFMSRHALGGGEAGGVPVLDFSGAFLKALRCCSSS